MAKKLLIIIPSYKQPDLLRRCLNSLALQSRQDFSVKIKDDGSGVDYQTLIAQFSALDITLERNSRNLGAINNIVSSLLTTTETEFIMCLHEDDFLHPQYLEQALTVLENNPTLAFVASPASYFNPGVNPPTDQLPTSGWQDYSSIEFAKYILNENKIAFGSIIYRRSSIRPEFIDLKNYAALFDRPFLLNILKTNNNRAAVLSGQFYYYQNHPYPDKRWQTLTATNIFNLYTFYQALAPGGGRRITSQYIFDLINLEPRNWTEIRAFIRRGQEAGFVSWRRINGKFILAAIFIAIFGKKNYDHLFHLIKD